MESWKRLYELVDLYCSKKLHEKIESADFICLNVKEEEPYYISILGNLGQCEGFSIYYGEKGLADLESISYPVNNEGIIKYLMYSQTCLTFYMGDSDEVPSNQRNIIRKLKRRYRGHNNWPYFMSFENRYWPMGIKSKKEVETFIIVLEALIYLADRIDDIEINFEDDEIIYMEIKDDGYLVEPMERPVPYNKFPYISLNDEKIIEELKGKSENGLNIYMDLSYLNQYIDDPSFSRPLNALFLILVDEASGMIINAHLLDEDESDISVILENFCNYVFGNGKPSIVYARNPLVHSVLHHLSEQLNFELLYNDCDIIDDIIDDMLNFM